MDAPDSTSSGTASSYPDRYPASPPTTGQSQKTDCPPAGRRRRLRRSPSAAAPTAPGRPWPAPRTAVPARERPARVRRPAEDAGRPSAPRTAQHHRPGQHGQDQAEAGRAGPGAAEERERVVRGRSRVTRGAKPGRTHRATAPARPTARGHSTGSATIASSPTSPTSPTPRPTAAARDPARRAVRGRRLGQAAAAADELLGAAVRRTAGAAFRAGREARSAGRRGSGGQGRREDVSSLRAGRGRPSRRTCAREGHQRVPRAHAEAIAVEGETTPVVVKLGVWISNTKSRRGKLTADQRGALTELGVEWA